MGLKVSRQACSTSDPCATNPGVSGCINDSNLNYFEWEWDGEPQDYNLEL
jgi:hypothetical protein